MKPQICICCGEPMTEGSGELSRNPNMCAACSSLADGLEETNVPAAGHFVAKPGPSQGAAPAEGEIRFFGR